MKIAPSLLSASRSTTRAKEMKWIAPALLVLFASCQSSSRTENVSNADSLTRDSGIVAMPRKPVHIAQQTPIPPAFPEWNDSTLTTSEYEAEAARLLHPLLKKYETGNYLSITGRIDSNYTTNDDGYVHNLVQREVEHIYLDSAFRIRAYTMDMKYKDIGGFGRMYTIYLFDKDSVIAGVEYTDTRDEVLENKLARFTKSRSQDIGFRVSITDRVDTLRETIFNTELRRYTLIANVRISKIAQGIRREWSKAKTIRGAKSVTVSEAIPSNEEYDVRKFILSDEVYEYFIRDFPVVYF